jgi:microsomal dipeptidase-like Zn-dependent dipeptidase
MNKVIGPGHVGLGLDFLEYLPGYEDTCLPGLDDASEAPAITAGLLARGISDGEIRSLLGENWLHM